MQINTKNYKQIINEVQKSNTVLVAVSKTKPSEAIKELYDLGQRDFGENYVQELTEKQDQLPADICWHFIGHLQTNKVKYIAPFVYLIHGIDSFKLLKEVNKQAEKNNRIIDVLLQIHIAKEETKFGLNEEELEQLIHTNNFISLKEFRNIRVRGLMGMASFNSDTELIRQEFRHLKKMYDQYATIKAENFAFSFLSMGMSGDYKIALEEGSTMIRIGSLLFGSR